MFGFLESALNSAKQMATWVATKSAGLADVGKGYTDATRQVFEAVRNTIGNIHPLIRNVPVLKDVLSTVDSIADVGRGVADVVDVGLAGISAVGQYALDKYLT